MNPDLFEYITKIIVKKKVGKTFKHVDTVVNSINNFPLDNKHELSNWHNNTR